MPAPSTAPSATSRKNPVPRDSRVKKPTESRFLYIEPLVAEDFDKERYPDLEPPQALKSAGRRSCPGLMVQRYRTRHGFVRRLADSFGDEIKRAPLHLGENAADIFADD